MIGFKLNDRLRIAIGDVSLISVCFGGGKKLLQLFGKKKKEGRVVWINEDDIDSHQRKDELSGSNIKFIEAR